MKLNLKSRLFLILFGTGFAGVASLLLIDLSTVAALLPAAAQADVPRFTPVIKLLTILQPTVLLILAVLIGIALAPRVGLSAPLSQAIAAGTPAIPALRPQLVPGVLGGLLGSLTILLTMAVFKPLLTIQTIEIIGRFQRVLPIPTRLLYGGLTEELLMRWGLMTLFVWYAWRLFQRRATKPTAISFVTAILVSSLVFGLGHLPVALFLLQDATVQLILFVIVANSAFGIVAGYLYWRYGLESAMIAHVLCHIGLAVASYAGAYF